MSYRVRLDGSFEVDSLDEAMALSSRLAARAVSAPPPAPRAHAPTIAPVDDESAWDRFIAAVNTKLQLQLLSTLKTRGEVRIDELRTDLGLDSNNAVSGTWTGILRRATEAGVSHDAIFTRTQTGRGKTHVVTYRAGPALQVRALPGASS